MKFDVGINQAIILSAHNNYVPFVASAGVTDDRISWITKETIGKSECDVWVDGYGKILMPGLTNAHCHGDMTFARGMGDDMTLLEQNEAFRDTNWFYTMIDDDDRYYSRQLTYCEALLSGTTFIMENMYWGLGTRSVDAMREIGIRGALAEDIREDFSKPDRLIRDEQIAALSNACEKNGIIPFLGSISEEDFEIERLQNINKKLKTLGIGKTFHLAENIWRVDLIRDRFQMGSVELLFQNHCLDEKTLASHAVYLDDREIALLAESGAKIVNTPLCEMKIQDGIAPIPKMVKAGVAVCLGTDGAVWNNSNDIFREMKGMALLHTINSGIRSLSKTDILDMATINGARAFRIQEDYGTIEEGKKADFILINTEKPHMRPLRVGLMENVTSNVVFNATGSDVTDVFVGGRRVVENGVLQGIDLQYIMQRVQSTSERIAQGIK